MLARKPTDRQSKETGVDDLHFVSRKEGSQNGDDPADGQCGIVDDKDVDFRMIREGTADDTSDSIGDADDREQKGGRLFIGAEEFRSGSQEHEGNEEAEKSNETGEAE